MTTHTRRNSPRRHTRQSSFDFFQQYSRKKHERNDATDPTIKQAKKQTHKPIVTTSPLQKYADSLDVRTHSEYAPAATPLSFTTNTTLDDETYVLCTLATTLVGVPVHPLDEITNAPASALISTRPSPFSVTVDATLPTPITLGETADTLITFRPPASTYSDDCVHREHSRYTPAGVLPLTAHVNVITEPDPLLDVIHVPAITAGFVAFGVEHDDAITNAIPSPDTLGIHDPLTVTI